MHESLKLVPRLSSLKAVQMQSKEIISYSCTIQGWIATRVCLEAPKLLDDFLLGLSLEVVTEKKKEKKLCY